jgi:hypothetical protein
MQILHRQSLNFYSLWRNLLLQLFRQFLCCSDLMITGKLSILMLIMTLSIHIFPFKHLFFFLKRFRRLLFLHSRRRGSTRRFFVKSMWKRFFCFFSQSNCLFLFNLNNIISFLFNVDIQMFFGWLFLNYNFMFYTFLFIIHQKVGERATMMYNNWWWIYLVNLLLHLSSLHSAKFLIW